MFTKRDDDLFEKNKVSGKSMPIVKKANTDIQDEE